ncbi:MAG: hypothetical protein NZM33_11530 [Bryobacteraceae bacterium]|nr:hypothetical protein [Bryobacteraceae bacterium]
MRRLTRVALALAFGLTFGGCRRSAQNIPADATREETRELATMVHVADPRTSLQLIRGFHEIEQNAWRWTMARFAVTLRAPSGASEKGATLVLQGAVPDPVIAQLKAVTLTADVEGVPLPPETFTRPGEYLYRRDVPPKAFPAEAVTVNFTLDKALAPGEADHRELGIVVTSVGFEAK